MYFRKLEKDDEKALLDLIKQIEDSLPDKKWWLPINSISQNYFFDDEWTYFLGLFDNDELIGASALFF